jgi:hypothetical protein
MSDNEVGVDRSLIRDYRAGLEEADGILGLILAGYSHETQTITVVILDADGAA